MSDLRALPRDLAATAMGLVSGARQARVFQPRGTTRTATVTVTGGGDWGARVLDEPARYEGVARVSRGAGLPAPLDVVGLALRLPSQGRGGTPLDLLVNSAGDLPGLRHVFLPSVLASTWSAVLPHRTGSGKIVVIGARPDAPDAFDLLVAPLVGNWTRWGRVELGREVLGEALRFAPMIGADDLVPTGPFARLRARSYPVSQAHRP